jgi:hypothetical protein
VRPPLNLRPKELAHPADHHARRRGHVLQKVGDRAAEELARRLADDFERQAIAAVPLDQRPPGALVAFQPLVVQQGTSVIGPESPELERPGRALRAAARAPAAPRGSS